MTVSSFGMPEVALLLSPVEFGIAVINANASVKVEEPLSNTEYVPEVANVLEIRVFVVILLKECVLIRRRV